MNHTVKSGLPKIPNYRDAPVETMTNRRRLNTFERLFVAGALSLAALSAPLTLRADPPIVPASVNAPVASAPRQEERLPTISIARLRELDRETRRLHHSHTIRNFESESNSETGLEVRNPNNGQTILVVFADITFASPTNPNPRKRLLLCPGGIRECIIRTLQGQDSIRGMIFDLTPLDGLYRQMTGKELRYVRLIAETGVQDGINYIQIYAVPVERLPSYLIPHEEISRDGVHVTFPSTMVSNDISPGIPIYSVAYANQALYPQRPQVVSMR